VGLLSRLLAHPLTRGLDLDDPRTTVLRRQVLAGKPFLRRVYADWYRRIAASLPAEAGPVLEIGTGAGFLSDFVPGLLRSDVLAYPGLDVVLDGTRLPFRPGALRAVVMTNALHHIGEPERFLREAALCVRPGGVLSMIEPWVTAWSRFVYAHLHHEAFEPDAPHWTAPGSGPLSGGNGALPWILFHRDLARFQERVPEWDLTTVEPFMPFRYLVSGGVSLRTLMPAALHGPWRLIEDALSPWSGATAMFAHFVLRRR
jgi:SAM-dependent methyltransferase